MRVRDRMSKPPVSIPPDMVLPDAMCLMKEHGFRRLPVVKDKRLVGIVTDRDLKEAMPSDATSLSIWELNFLLSKLEIHTIMTHPVTVIEEDATIEEAARTLLKEKIGGLPVVKKGVLTGMITVTDVLKAFVEGDHV